MEKKQKTVQLLVNITIEHQGSIAYDELANDLCCGLQYATNQALDNNDLTSRTDIIVKEVSIDMYGIETTSYTYSS